MDSAFYTIAPSPHTTTQHHTAQPGWTVGWLGFVQHLDRECYERVLGGGVGGHSSTRHKPSLVMEPSILVLIDPRTPSHLAHSVYVVDRFHRKVRRH
jgi:hypothetical protein